MPYKYKKEGNRYCVYNKNTNKKIGCTSGSIKKYLSALYANVPDSVKEELKEKIKNIIKEIINEQDNPLMISYTEQNTLQNVLNKNVGLPFDDNEKRSVILTQGSLGVKSLINSTNTEIKFATSDLFENNKINVIKKLKNMSDPTTLVYASFFTILEKSKEIEVDTNEKPEPPKVHIKLSQPFIDKSSEKLDILEDFIKQLDIK